MENETPEKRGKYERTTQEQLQYYVQFCKDHPELQTGKNCPRAPNKMQAVWVQLAENLNAMRGPTRTPVKWKDSLSQWKNQLRSRTSKHKVEANFTGGGPYRPDISEFEQQAIQTFGVAAVSGAPHVVTLGRVEPSVGPQSSVNQSVEELPFEVLSSPLDVTTLNNSSLSLPPMTTDIISEEGIQNTEIEPTGCPPRGKTSQAISVLNSAMERLKVRDIRDKQTNDLLLSTLQVLNDSVVRLTEALEVLNSKLQ